MPTGKERQIARDKALDELVKKVDLILEILNVSKANEKVKKVTKSKSGKK